MVSAGVSWPFQDFMIGTGGEVSSFEVRAEHNYGPYYLQSFAFVVYIVAFGVVEGSAEVSNGSKLVGMFFLE